MNRCSRCSTLPGPPAASGMLCIAPPLAHTLQTLRGLLKVIGCAFSEPAPNLLVVPLAEGVTGRLAQELSDRLSQAELRDARSLVVEEGKALTLSDLAAMQPLYAWVARVQGGWFTEMLRDERLTSHFQPIVRADDPGRVFAHECLLRGVGVDGSLVAPGRMYDAARDADLMFPLDRAARLTAIARAAAVGLDGGDSRLFINFNPTSIYDPNYCLRTTIAAISKTQLTPDRVVFEVVESDHINDLAHLRRIVEFYRATGFKIALDDLGSGYGSLNLLGELKPDYIKLDMQLIRGVDHEPFKAGIVRKLLEMAHDLGIESVAEGIETEAEWAWVRDHGADFAQGYLFARPEATPPRPRVPSRPREMAASGR